MRQSRRTACGDVFGAGALISFAPGLKGGCETKQIYGFSISGLMKARKICYGTNCRTHAWTKVIAFDAVHKNSEPISRSDTIRVGRTVNWPVDGQAGRLDDAPHRTQGLNPG